MKHVLWILPALLALLPSPATRSADPFDASSRATAAAPILDDQTIAVIHIDLQKVDLAAAFKAFVKPGERSEEQRAELAEFQQAAQRWLDAMLAAGGRNIYIVVSLADVPQTPPYLFVPVGEGADVRAVSGLLFSGKKDGPTRRDELPADQQRRPRPIEICDRLGEGLYAGSQAALERLRNAQPSGRPHLAAAFEAAGDTAVQVLVVPSDDQRRMLREMLPELPGPFGVTGAMLADGLKWAALGIGLPPQSALNATIQSADEKSAAEFGAWLTRAIDLLMNAPEIKAAAPDWKVPRPTVAGDRLTFAFADPEVQLAVLINGYLLSEVLESREGARREICRNNLKQSGLAMHKYHDRHQSFPAAANYAADGKPLLSWRVHLLPFLGEAELYQQFRLDEPWDSEHNRKLISKMPAVYAHPGSKLAEQGRTTYLAPIGPQTAFPGKTATRMRDFTWGASNTILIVEVPEKQAVVWTKPDDWTVDWNNPKQGLFGAHGDYTYVLMADGSVRLISTNEIDDEVLKRLLAIAAPED